MRIKFITNEVISCFKYSFIGAYFCDHQLKIIEIALRDGSKHSFKFKSYELYHSAVLWLDCPQSDLTEIDLIKEAEESEQCQKI